MLPDCSEVKDIFILILHSENCNFVKLYILFLKDTLPGLKISRSGCFAEPLSIIKPEKLFFSNS
jgi:hypothetical protein